MRDVLLLVAGAILALLGGLIQQYWQERRSERQTVRLHVAITQADALVRLRALAEELRSEVRQIPFRVREEGDDANIGPGEAEAIATVLQRYSDAWDNELGGRIFDPGIFEPFVSLEVGARAVAQAVKAGDRERYLKEAKEFDSEARVLLSRIDAILGVNPRRKRRSKWWPPSRWGRFLSWKRKSRRAVVRPPRGT